MNNKEIIFMTWNIHQNIDDTDVICDLIVQLKVNILILNESKIDDKIIFEKTKLKRVYVNNHKVKLYTDIDKLKCINDTSSEYLNFFHLTFSNYSILITGVHLPSKLYADRDTQTDNSREYIRLINEQSTLIKSSNVIIIGDFNMNPYDIGMTIHSGFNCVSDLELSKKPRKKGLHNYERYYNPLFSFLGDFVKDTNTKKTPGNYYISSLKSVNDSNWNILDNILIKGNISDFIKKESIQFIENKFIYLKGKKVISDHLPLTFIISIPWEQ